MSDDYYDEEHSYCVGPRLCLKERDWMFPLEEDWMPFRCKDCQE